MAKIHNRELRKVQVALGCIPQMTRVLYEPTGVVYVYMYIEEAGKSMWADDYTYRISHEGEPYKDPPSISDLYIEQGEWKFLDEERMNDGYI